VCSGANERRLINDLGLYNVSVYNKLERPVVNESDTLVVSFSLVLQQIIGVVSRHLINNRFFIYLFVSLNDIKSSVDGSLC